MAFPPIKMVPHRTRIADSIGASKRVGQCVNSSPCEYIFAYLHHPRRDALSVDVGLWKRSGGFLAQPE